MALRLPGFGAHTRTIQARQRVRRLLSETENCVGMSHNNEPNTEIEYPSTKTTTLPAQGPKPGLFAAQSLWS